jgi:peptidyl-prolyl cis-trans isomerase D
MLKTMRKNVKSLKPVLWIVVATFLISIWAIWGGAGRLGEGMASNTLASVGGSKITSDEYFQGLRSRIESVKKQFSGLTSALIQQLNIPQQTLGQLIQQKLLLQVASDMGLRATDLEVRDRIVSYPVFQRDGQFVGFDDYKRILEYNHIPL